MKYELLQTRGALREASEVATQSVAPTMAPPATRSHSRQRERLPSLSSLSIPPAVIARVPESIAREQEILPISYDGETIVIAASQPNDLALEDKLRFTLAKNVQLVGAAPEQIRSAIDRHYQPSEGLSADSMLQDFDEADDYIEGNARTDAPAWRTAWRAAPRGMEAAFGTKPRRKGFASPPATPRLFGGRSMFFYTVNEGQQVLLCHRNGSMEPLEGPRRVWAWGKRFLPMELHTAHPGEFLIVRFRDGRQEHLAGPSRIWFDPRIHERIERQDGLQIAAKEAVVVYSQPPGKALVSRRIVHGPAVFIPEPGEWLHRFSWHSSKGGSKGVQKIPGGLVFNKLWLLPDQMYHDVPDVRTGDDAVLTIRLMIFFELVDIERMLDTTHDPIGDFINAATSDAVDFVGRHDFDSFKRNTDKLNELDTYRQLTRRAGMIGYRINNVVYRGYGAPDSLQQMHNQAIEARTRLQLERATEQQTQDLENYKLQCQLDRATRRRTEQSAEVRHDLELARERQEADLRRGEAQQEFARRQRELDAGLRGELERQRDADRRAHLASLRDLGVDLTEFLTQSRADQVIELRGNSGAHVHLEKSGANGRDASRGSTGPKT